MSIYMRDYLIALWAMLIACCMGHSAVAQTLETRAKAAYVVDFTTGTVLLSKNADRPLPPASMSKLMTAYMVFEALKDGRLQLDERIPISSHAASYGGSSMFLDTTDRVRVEDLLRGVVVLSGNDASAALAEALSPDGTEAGFARMMTRRARQLGMNNSSFINSNGWPAAGHKMSMKDLAILAERIIVDFPTYYPLFAEEQFLFDGRVPANTQNRNPLLGLGIGADGLKTGHTNEAGYGLVGSAQQGNRRIIFVLGGLDSVRARAEEAEKVVNWAFRQFSMKDVFKKGQKVATTDVWLGALLDVDLGVAQDVSLLLPVFPTEEAYTAKLVYRSPIQAPIYEGQVLGALHVMKGDNISLDVPLVAKTAVDLGGFEARIQTAVKILWNKFGPDAALLKQE